MKNKLYLIISENKDIQEYHLNKIILSNKIEQDSIVKHDMSISSIKDLLEELSMRSLFSSTKFVIASNFSIDKISDNEYSYFEEFLKQPIDDNYLVLQAQKLDTRKKISKLLKDKFQVIEESSFSPDKISDYVIKYLKDNDFKMNKYDIDLFINKVGNNLTNINLELDKLMIYKSKEQEITSEDINLLISDNIDNIMYEFTNAVIDKNYDKSFKMYQQFKKDNLSTDYIISSLAGAFRNSLTIKLLKQSGKSNLDISKIIGKKEFYVKKMLERLYYYSVEELVKILKSLANIDYNLKSGKSNIDELELFILKN